MMTTPNTGVGDNQWHIELDGKRSSPMPASAVRNLIDAGKLTDKSLAWRPGMPT